MLLVDVDVGAAELVLEEAGAAVVVDVADVVVVLLVDAGAALFSVAHPDKPTTASPARAMVMAVGRLMDPPW